jgi:hypothetical protein
VNEDMNPIVNPIYFYLASVGDTVQILAGIVMAVTTIIMIGLFVDVWADLSNGNNDNEHKAKVQALKMLGVILVVSTALKIFVPSSQTVYQIIAASVITPDNINMTQENIVDFINNIAKALHNAKY